MKDEYNNIFIYADLHGYLEKVEFHVDQWHPLVHLVVVLDDAVHCLWHVLEHKVKVELILLSCREKTVLERHSIGVVKKSHGLQLTVLEPFVLKNLFYCYSFPSL